MIRVTPNSHHAMQSRNSREGHYCGYTTAPDGQGRRHVRSHIRRVSAGTATLTLIGRLTAKAIERRQMALVARIMDEDRDALRELARR